MNGLTYNLRTIEIVAITKRERKIVFTSVNQVVQHWCMKFTIRDIHLQYRSCLQYSQVESDLTKPENAVESCQTSLKSGVFYRSWMSYAISPILDKDRLVGLCSWGRGVGYGLCQPILDACVHASATAIVEFVTKNSRDITNHHLQCRSQV